MKRALLWLGPLACLALACLYAYAWFTRDPLAIAFDRIEVGMKVEDAMAIMGEPVNAGFGVVDNRQVAIVIWSNERCWCQIACDDERVVHKYEETIFQKIGNWVCDPASIWAPKRVYATNEYSIDSDWIEKMAMDLPVGPNQRDEP